MFVLTCRKLWNFQNQDNYHDTRVVDTGVIRERTVEAVIAKAVSLVVGADAHYMLHNIQAGAQCQGFRIGEHYSYEFDDTIREVVREIPFQDKEIEESELFAARISTLKQRAAAAKSEREEREIARKREQYDRLQAELGES